MPTTPIDAETRASGGPVEDPDHDDFERVKYAQRIAETLIKRRSQKSIVVGLYGKWGEGKSSVLHFIRRRLAEAADTVVVLNFNPWRFSDETQLLVNFFGELAKIIGQNLLTKKQRAVKGLSSYVAPLVPSVSLGPASVDVGKSLEALLKMAQPEIDEQRERIEKLILESGKRVVVIIDDIDRLEKSQIQAVFRLVKLTADFNQTSYLLSFDDEMVARAIGEVFSPSTDDATGGRTLLAGQNFLEKIIQVPLRLPFARPDDLLRFCWERLGEAVEETGIDVDAPSRDRLFTALRSGILPRLSTPRMAVRFANAVQFGLPLLEGEVDTVDQILVEGMHIFYPELHRFVASHESDFVGNIDITVDEGRKKVLETVLSIYQGDDYRAAVNLLCTLFPAVTRLLFGGVPYMSRYSVSKENTSVRQKGVASSSHFARYFAYSVVRGDVSDREFDEFLKGESTNQLTVARRFVGQLGVSLFLQKVEYQVQVLTAEQACNLWNVVVGLSTEFSGAHGPMKPWSLNSQSSVAVQLMIQLLFRVEGTDARRQLVESLVASGGTFHFAKELQYELRTLRRRETSPAGYSEEDQQPSPERLFTVEEWQTLMDESLPSLFLDRALTEAGSVPLYKSHPFYAFNLLFTTWAGNSRQPDVVTYIRDLLTQHPEDIHDLVAVCSSAITMEGKHFLASVTREKVAAVTELFGSYLYNEVRKTLGNEPVTEYPGDERDYEQPAPENRLRQFVYLYENLESTPPATD